MQVNSVNNFKITSFGNEKTEVKPTANEVKPEAEMKATLNQDRFQNAQTSQNQLMPGLQIPSVSQISKMQTVQKVIGGTVAALGALGMASAFSSKTWVRALFAIPVGGFITLFGVNMFRMAGVFDKLKAATNSQPNQQ